MLGCTAYCLQANNVLFDHLVRTGEQRPRNGSTSWRGRLPLAEYRQAGSSTKFRRVGMRVRLSQNLRLMINNAEGSFICDMRYARVGT
jgi:hypothetical protein